MDLPQSPVPTPPIAPPQTQLPPNAPSLKLDQRTIETMKWSAVWNAVGNVIEVVAGYISAYFIGGVIGEFARSFGGLTNNNFPVGPLISSIIWGVIYGAVIGFFLSKFYPQIQEWNRRYLKGRLNTFFKLLFYPALAAQLIVFFLTSFVGLAIGFIPLAIICGGLLLSSYIYAKMLTAKVGQMY